MVQIQLFVDGQEVELYKDESVTLTQSIQDILNIEKVFTDYSRTFNVPASKTNNKIFKHFYNYYIDGFDARNRVVAELHLNYKPFKKGKIKLEGVQLKNNEAQSYKLTFFGETITLKEKFGEDQLGSLTQLYNFSFLYNDTNIAAYMANGLDGNIGSHQIENAVIIPLITHTDRLIYDSGDDTADTNNINYDILDTNVHGVKFSQLKPAIRLLAIIRAIEYKYDIQFSDDFFSTSNLAFYQLYMWLHTKEGNLFTDNDAQYIVEGFTNVVGDINDIKGVHNSYFKNQFNDDKNKREMKVRVTPSGSDEYNLVVKKDGEEFKRFDGLTGETTNGESSGSKAFEIPEGDYTFYIETSAASTFDVSINVLNDPTSWLRSKKDIDFTGSAEVLADEEVTITAHVPEMKVIDFITGIWKMFNLTSYVNKEGVIVVQTLDSFYASSSKTWDITDHVDKTEKIVDSVIPYNNVEMGYEGTDTFLAKNHLSLANKPWGQLSYKLASDEGDEYKFKVPFEHMKFERLKDVSNTDDPLIMYGWSVDSKQQPTIGKPLLFYPVVPVATIAAVGLDGTRKNIPAPYMPSNSLNINRGYGLAVAAQSLNFHSEYDEYDAVPNEKTLVKTYYEEYLKDIFDPRKRLVFMSAYLPLSITEQLNLADKIIVFDKLYRINKITTNFETNKSDLELTNILEERTFNNSVYSFEIDLSSLNIFADATYLTADMGNVTTDGFTLPPETTEVPEEIPSNEITPPSDEPCVVTAATIQTSASTAYCDKIEFNATITSKGTLCGQENIDEYGFLIASNSAYLTSTDDIDTLKADSNVTTVSIQRSYATNAPSLTIGEKTTTVTGLNDPETRYARFYVRTNVQDLFDEADAISSVITESTDCSVSSTADATTITVDDTNSVSADAGDTDGDGVVESTTEVSFWAAPAGYGATGYETTPTLAQIQANAQHSVECDQTEVLGKYYHNGTGTIPVVGDSVKLGTYKNYSGGTNSFSVSFDDATNEFMAFGVANPTTVNETTIGTIVYGTGTVNKFIVVEFATAKVVAVYDCTTPPVPQSYLNMYIYQYTNTFNFTQTLVESIGSSVCGNSYGGLTVIYNGEEYPAYTISHNGSGDNPVPGDRIKIDRDSGVPQTTSFGDYMTQLNQYNGIYFSALLTDENFIARYIITFNKTGRVYNVHECT